MVLSTGPHLYRWSQAILPPEGLVEKLWILVAPQPMLNLDAGVEGHTAAVPLMSGGQAVAVTRTLTITADWQGVSRSSHHFLGP